MSLEIHKASDRGYTKEDWLTSYHSFSFNEYYNPHKTRFGKLVVLNDDTIAPSEGFPTHSHQNMEIITIVTRGELTHRDSTGGNGTINSGEVQVMSAGKGVKHSEFNNSSTDLVHLFQIWIEPKNNNIKPRYDQTTYSLQPNIPTLLASNHGGLHIEQDATVSILHLELSKSLTFHVPQDHGAYVFLIEGELQILNHLLHKRDAAAITHFRSYSIKSIKDSTILIFTVPL
ncbi:pirin family protein [Candidatus Woesearchaeota archaeon]|nr:pirin family protein [Candidatus Woesearchaeota archaeon]